VRPPPPAHKYLQRKYVLDAGGPGLDQWISSHGNGLHVVGLCGTHPAVRLSEPIAVDFATAREKGEFLTKRVHRMVHSMNSVLLGTPQHPLCTITLTDGSKYTPQSCVNAPCLLLECNPALTSNPAMLKEKSDDAGFLAILQPMEHATLPETVPRVTYLSYAEYMQARGLVPDPVILEYVNETPTDCEE